MKKISAKIWLPHTGLLRCSACLVACCVFGACTTAGRAPSETPSVTAELPASPLEYYEWVQAAAENALQAELDTLETTLSSYSLIAAVRASTILATSGLADNKSAQEATVLLTRAATLEANTDMELAYKIFGEVLQAFLQQRQDLQTARTTNRRALTEIDSLKKSNAELQQQIEELTSIERQIIEREQRNTLEP